MSNEYSWQIYCWRDVFVCKATTSESQVFNSTFHAGRQANCVKGKIQIPSKQLLAFPVPWCLKRGGATPQYSASQESLWSQQGRLWSCKKVGEMRQQLYLKSYFFPLAQSPTKWQVEKNQVGGMDGNGMGSRRGEVQYRVYTIDHLL